MKFETIEELIKYYHYKNDTVYVANGNELEETKICNLKTNRVFSHSFENYKLVIVQF